MIRLLIASLLVICCEARLSTLRVSHLDVIPLRYLKIALLRGGQSNDQIPSVPVPSNYIEQEYPSLNVPEQGSWLSHEEHVPEGDMPLRTAILNLITDLCAHGMLPLAFGIASSGGSGLLTSIGLVAIFGIVSAYTIISLGRASELTGDYSFKKLWSTLISPNSAWVIESAFAVMTFGCCIFYSAFIGDLFSALAQTMSFIPDIFKRRWVILCSLSLFPLLPLCLLKNLSALQLTSFGGLMSVLYTTYFVIKRSFDGSYAPGGKYFESIDAKFRNPLEDSWGSVGLWKVGSGTVTLMNMACVAFMAHYNGVKYYEELEKRSVKRYSIAIGSGMAASFCVFITMMLFGFRTFGSATQPLVLNNYHRSDDTMASIARFTTGCAIVCGYPIMFTALKSSSINAVQEISKKFKSMGNFALQLDKDDALRTIWAMSLLAVITAMACDKSEEDVAVVVGLIGALLGSGANFIIPAILNLRLFKRLNRVDTFWSEYTLNKALLVAGAIFMVVGTKSVVHDAKHGSHH